MSALKTVLLARLTAAYEAHADPKNAAPMRAYMRERFSFLGIERDRLDALDREVLAGLDAPTERDLAAIARACWKKEPREFQYFALKYLRKWTPKVASAGFLDVLGELIANKSWWDTVDELAQHPVGALVAKHPELRATMDAWARSDDLWLARAAILHQNRYRERTDPRRLFAYCRSRAAEKDFFMRKAIGWALRAYAATDPRAVARFVADHDAALSPLSKREALRGVARAS
ncbi:MAG: DNA alkylation repair protein [Deltaproteobacteria bacterium]|nr:DNA alkylation repair protein [Deltaproteobacteria bacterium]